MKPILPPNFPYSAVAHGPVLYAHRLIGCSCGFVPGSPTKPFANVYESYKRHRKAAAGEGNDFELQPALYGFGPKIGQRVGGA